MGHRSRHFARRVHLPAGPGREDVVVDSFVITCEHGGNRIPAPLRPLFAGWQATLDTHRGYDAGALQMARALARAFEAPLVFATISRLVIDLNRSIGHPRLYSEATRALPADARAQIVATCYQPYRQRVESLVRSAIARGRRVVHVSSHSFTPVLDGKMRHADLGLLYDPARAPERELCARWKAELAISAPGLRVRRNYPYAGVGDGLTAYLRTQFAADAYIGIELECNQRLVDAADRGWAALRRQVTDSLSRACAMSPVTKRLNAGKRGSS